MQDFLSFKKFITPVFIQIIFWVGAAIIFIIGLVMVIKGADSYYGGGSIILLGLVYMIIGPFLWRIYCEILIIIFKIYEDVHELRNQKEPPTSTQA